MINISRRERSELASLLRRWKTTSEAVRELLAGQAYGEGAFDHARLRAAWDARGEAEEAIITFWSRPRE